MSDHVADPVSPFPLPADRWGGATLHVCVTCRQGEPATDGADPPGARLFAALHALAPDAPLRPERCLAACDRGCTAVLGAPGKWRMLLGGLDRSHAADLLDYLGLYADAPTGSVLPSRRAPSLRHVVLGRVPA